jgi:broad specificity phosphatase PhoE
VKVGLVRHFRVRISLPRTTLGTQADLMRWFDKFDAAEVEEGTVDLAGIPWDRCYSSDLPRAVKTAESIYPGEIVQLETLREVRPYPVSTRRDFRLPLGLWSGLARLAFAVSHPSQLESKADFEKRIKSACDRILSGGEENILVVSHGMVMIQMRRELLSRGFRGSRFGIPAHGTLYIFER